MFWRHTPPELTAEVIRSLIETLRVYGPDDICGVIGAFGVVLLAGRQGMERMTDISVFLDLIRIFGADQMEEAFERILTETLSAHDDELDSYGEWHGAA